MPRPGNSYFSKPTQRPKDTYGRLSMRPLHVLIFLLPMMALYEFGSIRYLTDPATGVQANVTAWAILGSVFKLFGAAGIHLPTILLTVVLLVWHILEGD